MIEQQRCAEDCRTGIGFPAIFNDHVLIPGFLRHGRSLGDARDYICSCCYENTIPGREAFHPNGVYLNLPYVLELALNGGRPEQLTLRDFLTHFIAFREEVVARRTAYLLRKARERMAGAKGARDLGAQVLRFCPATGVRREGGEWIVGVPDLGRRLHGR